MRENRIARLVLTKQSPIHTTMFWCLSGSHKSKWFKTLSQVLRTVQTSGTISQLVSTFICDTAEFVNSLR
jgi:hypothetical protein